MVQFARFPPDGVDSPPGARGFPRAGCPIRRSPDQRLPAAPRGVSPPSRVLRRPDTPRHPPCALASFHRAYPLLAARGGGFPRPRPRRAFAIALRLVRYEASPSRDGGSWHQQEEGSDRREIPGNVCRDRMSGLCRPRQRRVSRGSLQDKLLSAARSRTATVLRHRPDGPPPPSTASLAPPRRESAESDGRAPARIPGSSLVTSLCDGGR